MRIRSILLIAAFGIFTVFCAGCPSIDPTVKSDQAAQTAAAAALANAKAVAATQPTTQNVATATADAMAYRTATDNLTKAMTDAMDRQTAALQKTLGTGATVAASTGTPIGGILASIFGIASVGAGVYAKIKDGQAKTAQQKQQVAETAIADGAVPLAKLLTQVTDKAELGTDVTTIAGIAPGLINFIQHPAAAGAIATAAAVAPAVKAIASGASPATVAAVGAASTPPVV